MVNFFVGQNVISEIFLLLNIKSRERRKIHVKDLISHQAIHSTLAGKSAEELLRLIEDLMSVLIVQMVTFCNVFEMFLMTAFHFTL